MSMQQQSRLTMPRNNQMIWRLAEWLSEAINSPVVPWRECSEGYKNDCYDVSAELLKKINNNEFTGEDTHKD